MSTQTLGIPEIAALLHKSPNTIRRQVSEQPHLLPPRVVIPGSRRVLWLESTVYAWLKRHEQVKRGRPRKQLAPDHLAPAALSSSSS